MDRFEAMSMLIEVVDRGSLSAAGRALGVPVPTLSRKISDLESRLGARLLTRTTRRITLTETGLAYVAAARRILEQVEDAEHQASGEFTQPKGDLVISAPVLFGRLHVLPVVSDFLAMFPEINVRLLLTDRNMHLVDEHVDMAVRIGKLPDSSMVATRIGAMRMVLCASPALLERHGIPHKPANLNGMPFVTFEGPTPSPYLQMLPKGARSPIQLSIKSRLSVSAAEAAVDAAIHGVGVTRLLQYQVAAAVQSGALKIILDKFEPEPFPVSLVHVSRGQMPLKMRRFLDFAAPRLRQSILTLAEG